MKVQLPSKTHKKLCKATKILRGFVQIVDIRIQDLLSFRFLRLSYILPKPAKFKVSRNQNSVLYTSMDLSLTSTLQQCSSVYYKPVQVLSTEQTVQLYLPLHTYMPTSTTLNYGNEDQPENNDSWTDLNSPE